MAFRKKKDQLLKYNPDILIIQECENPAVAGNWTEFSDWQWVGDNKHKGLGVFCCNGLEITKKFETDSSLRYILPVSIPGAKNILGVWAMNDTDEPQQRYIGQVYIGLQYHQNVVDSNTVVAGDFNWNAIWDESPNMPLYGNLSEIIELLENEGLISVYHEVTNSSFGEESDPTFFMYKKTKSRVPY